jgi:excisionase family DNA binding protein
MPSLTPEPDVPAEKRYVSTAQVAQALGVSVTTVKRWVDNGVLPAHRTAGGHRKLLLADVIRLTRGENLPQADLSKLIPKQIIDLENTGQLYNHFQNAIDQEDCEQIRNIIIGSYQAGLPVETLADRVIAPAMSHIGHEWHNGRLPILKEHRLTQSCISALYELRGQLRGNAETDRPIAVGGAPEHDHYVLPTLLTKLTLMDCGWEAINTGPHTPMSALATALDTYEPLMLWVSVTHLTDADHFVQEFRQLARKAEEKGVAIAIGGRGLTEGLRSTLPYTMFGDGLTQLAAFARSLHRRPGRPRRGRPSGSSSRSTDTTTENS